MEYLKLPVDSIELDKSNPRIQQWLEIYGEEITSEAIALALNASSGTSNTSTYQTLKESIRVNGGIINPIIVNKRKDGKYIVIEGNTRVQIYKEFKQSDPSGPWDSIISIVYDDMSDDTIHAIRLQSHLVGPRDWDAFSKAKYLNQLSNIDKMPMSTIISFCGGKKAEIIKLINAYNDMLSYYFPLTEEHEMDPDPREFSKFAELQNAGVVEALLRNKYTKKEFANWVISGNIDTAQNVRKLGAVLANPIAKSVFLRSNLSDAIEHLNSEERSKAGLEDATLIELARELDQRIDKIEYSYVKNLRSNPEFGGEKSDLQSLHDDLQDLISEITME